MRDNYVQVGLRGCRHWREHDAAGTFKRGATALPLSLILDATTQLHSFRLERKTVSFFSAEASYGALVVTPPSLVEL